MRGLKTWLDSNAVGSALGGFLSVPPACLLTVTLGALLPATNASDAWSQNQQTPRPAQIDRNGTLILIRSSLIALEEANETGNYTVLRDLGAPGFRDANDSTRLGEIFANLRRQNVDLSGVLALDPQLTVLPQIDDKGLMHMTGFFPSVPTQVNFDLAYAPVNGRWRLFGIAVRLGSSSPVAPQPVPSPQTSAAVPSKPQKPTKAGAGRTKGSGTKPPKKASEPRTQGPSESKPQETKSPDPKSPETAPPAAGGASLDQ